MTQEQATQRAEMLSALRAFICQRPGFDTCNYASLSDYRKESREVTRDRDDALALLAEVSHYASLSPDYILRNARQRLQWDDTAKAWDYVTGQYFPTEYRLAAARVLSSALFDFWRDECGCGDRDKMHAQARRAFRSPRMLRYFR